MNLQELEDAQVEEEQSVVGDNCDYEIFEIVEKVKKPSDAEEKVVSRTVM